ncbi:MAG: NAD-dependent epimerase/dehydratase family protein [Deltaproteobacteria bacterium]|nr:NAD-dependent epimerase/dehydratase family protein [Deltaproteobacteria bacterium]
MKALVTGGGGFLGKAIVSQLLARGDEVRSFSRGDYPELRELGVDVVQGDISNALAVASAAKGCDIVFHVAAKTGIWGPYKGYFSTNVVGTENVIAACRQHKITRLVYTSTPSVVHSGGDVEGINESAPYPDHFDTHYAKTKALAEQMVFSANGDDLATVAIRPHLVWGPGDPNFLPRFIARAKAGRLRKVGKKPHLVDCLYIDNAAEAHLLAADRLSIGSAIAGKAYFISQGEPIDIAELMSRIIGTAGLPPIDRSIPPAAAYAAGWLLEMLYTALRIRKEPPMTRFLARQLSTAHWFDITAARRDLDYHPAVSIEEGLKRLEEWLRDQSSI